MVELIRELESEDFMGLSPLHGFLPIRNSMLSEEGIWYGDKKYDYDKFFSGSVYPREHNAKFTFEEISRYNRLFVKNLRWECTYGKSL